jgi:hypothetical protein
MGKWQRRGEGSVPRSRFKPLVWRVDGSLIGAIINWNVRLFLVFCILEISSDIVGIL